MIYLLADTISGVWEVKDLGQETCEVLNQTDFFERLSTLKEGVTIGASVDAEYASKIEKEYFVSWLQ